MGLLKKLFQTPLYRRFVILASTGVIGRLWDYDVWVGLAFYRLDELLRENVGSLPSVHCRQTTGSDSEAVKLGKADWSLRGSEKWAHGSGLTRGKCAGWRFTDLQVYIPARRELEADMDFPLVHLHLVPIGYGSENAARYDQVVQVSVRDDHFRKEEDAIGRIIEQLGESLRAPAIFTSVMKVKSLNSFESILREDFMYTGMLDNDLPDERRMKGRWRRLK